MKYILLAPLFAVLLLSSCESVRTTQTAKAMDIYGPGVIQYPVIADLEVQNTKVSAIESGYSANVAALKIKAVNSAVQNAGADLLVEPVFEVQTTGTRVVVTASGYPASYKNFRSATEADLPMIEAGVLHKAEKAEVTTAPTNRKGGGLAIVALLAILTVVAVIAGG